jgi:hypothetical protein
MRRNRRSARPKLRFAGNGRLLSMACLPTSFLVFSLVARCRGSLRSTETAEMRGSPVPGVGRFRFLNVLAIAALGYFDSAVREGRTVMETAPYRGRVLRPAAGN